MQSIYAFLLDVYDILIFHKNKKFSENSARIIGVPNEKNSVIKAAEILRNNFDMPLPHVEIIKQIPIEAGLGGGSSDCACFVNAVFDIWNFSRQAKLKYIKLFESLGADACVFLHKYFLNINFVYIAGNGIEGVIESINIPDLNNCYLLIVNNNLELSTKKVFENYSKDFKEKINKNEINFNIITPIENSLEQSAVELEPNISKILEDIEKTQLISFGVSGSGPTCFGIFSSEEYAIKAKSSLDQKYNFVKLSKISM
ncbi:MAG: hypothetical protein LBE97_02315 [Holosporales bacterium]|nr:hypothetical protein [Holosporales bacterium]